jgi:hypothetical protein
MIYLPGIHEPDEQAAALFGATPGTVVFAEAIGSNPNDRSGRDYRWWSDRGFRVLVRLNNGWRPDGTIPAPALYEAFAQRCANFVAASSGCAEWIIGNEPNHEQERPLGQAIRSGDYARCFALCRSAIQRVQAGGRVIVAAVAPWNEQSGDWLAYWREMLAAIAANGGADGIALHAYTHGADPTLIDSDHRVNGWYWHFRTFEQQLEAVPAALRHLPADITEANQGDEPWLDANAGWVQRAVHLVNKWNKQPGTQKVRSVVLYRWPRYDTTYSFADKAGVQDDFREACKQGYRAPEVGAVDAPQSAPLDTFIPSVSTGGDKSDAMLPPREISEEFKQRVPRLDFLPATRTQPYYRLIKAEYVPDGARRFGPDHHILVEVLDKEGQRKMGVPVRFYWGDGHTDVPTNKVGGPYAADYGMTSAGHGFGVFVESDAKSDLVFGMGLGKLGNEHMGDHVTYYLVFQEVFPSAQSELPTQPTAPASVPALVHPVSDPRWRMVTQRFGERPEYYARFSVDGVPLKGHNGIDFGTPKGTPIVVVDDGVVIETGDDADGYGLYAKVQHAWGESLYAHLAHLDVPMGARLVRGVQVGLSGNTGNSTGPHLHFGMRVNPYNRQDGWGGYIDPARYLINIQPGEKQRPARERYLPWFRQYGAQFGVEWHLLAALAYHENKYQREPVSPKGALGLMQFMPATWADMQTQLGVTDPLDPEQSIKAAAYYLAQIRSYLIRHKKMGVDWMLAGYNWGMGYSAQGSWEQVPPETKRYIDLIKETGEALRRWEDGW